MQHLGIEVFGHWGGISRRKLVFSQLGLAECCLDNDLVVAHPLLLVRIPCQRCFGSIELFTHSLGLSGRLWWPLSRVFSYLTHLENPALLFEQFSFFVLCQGSIKRTSRRLRVAVSEHLTQLLELAIMVLHLQLKIVHLLHFLLHLIKSS